MQVKNCSDVLYFRYVLLIEPSANIFRIVGSDGKLPTWTSASFIAILDTAGFEPIRPGSQVPLPKKQTVMQLAQIHTWESDFETAQIRHSSAFSGTR